MGRASSTRYFPCASVRRRYILKLNSSVSKLTAKVPRALEIEGKRYNDNYTLTSLVDRNDWVNPETLPPMPQCIAQQDQAVWLHTMTQCMWRQCTRHFTWICTQHEWLIQRSCLSTGFSPDVIKQYLRYCSRSMLAKAQLYQWIHGITGRTWLVDVGDTIELQSLSPASLAQGHAALDVTNKAPTCLKDSASASSKELFQHVLASCSFTAHAQHTGNSARPWEYSGALHSLIALDSETVGYDLTQRMIAHGEFFDKHCFCENFSIDLTAEPCSGPGFAMTRERLWMTATCGSTSLPKNYTDGLQTTPFDYIPIKNWHWPACVDDIPKEVIRLVDQYETDACDIDSSGYCISARAVDRARFCREVSYDTCKGSCHVFEKRIEYVEWLHNLCGGVEGWYGLPKHWAQLAAPTRLDMMPWKWSVKPFGDVSPVSDELPNSAQTCTSTKWKLDSLVAINTIPLLIAFLASRHGAGRSTLLRLQFPHPTSWRLRGFIIAALHLLANALIALIAQTTPGYANIPTLNLILLWCSLPRLTWCTIFLRPRSLTTIPSNLFAETLLQTLTAFAMLSTLNYGWEHNFYTNNMVRLNSFWSAKVMYASALMWLLVVIVTLALLLTTPSGAKSAPSSQNLAKALARFNKQWTCVEHAILRYWLFTTKGALEEELLLPSHGNHTTYGTLPSAERTNDSVVISSTTVRMCVIVSISMALLCAAQCMFWVGFIELSLNE
jgi:hypothetical protein